MIKVFNKFLYIIYILELNILRLIIINKINIYIKKLLRIFIKIKTLFL